MNVSQESKRLLSGIKPTGRLHIGNYFGAMRQFIEMQDTYDSYVFVANYHAMTSVQDADILKKQSLDIAIDYLAAGLDPQKVNLYLQSDVPEVHELTWIFNCLTTMPYLQQAHAFKDAVAKDVEGKPTNVNVGTFDYPILMAADILIQNADVVPVGKDQKQHVEYARDIAEKFNRIFKGEVFTIPKPVIPESSATIPGLDGRKMSKSYDNVIPLFGSDDELKKVVMSIPTDSKTVEEPKDPDTCNIFQLHKYFSGDMIADIEDKYRKGGMGYGDSKKILLDNIGTFISPMRERRAELLERSDDVYAILQEGGAQARRNAQALMKKVREVTGIEITYT